MSIKTIQNPQRDWVQTQNITLARTKLPINYSHVVLWCAWVENSGLIHNTKAVADRRMSSLVCQLLSMDLTVDFNRQSEGLFCSRISLLSRTLHAHWGIYRLWIVSLSLFGCMNVSKILVIQVFIKDSSGRNTDALQLSLFFHVFYSVGADFGQLSLLHNSLLIPYLLHFSFPLSCPLSSWPVGTQSRFSFQ